MWFSIQLKLNIYKSWWPDQTILHLIRPTTLTNTVSKTRLFYWPQSDLRKNVTNIWLWSFLMRLWQLWHVTVTRCCAAVTGSEKPPSRSLDQSPFKSNWCHSHTGNSSEEKTEAFASWVFCSKGPINCNTELPGAAWFMLTSLVIRTSNTWTRGSGLDSDLNTHRDSVRLSNITHTHKD